MPIHYLVYEDGDLWLDGVKKRKPAKKIIAQINKFYKEKIPKTVYGWLTAESNFIEDKKTMLERGLVEPPK